MPRDREKQRLYTAQYRAAHPEKVREAKRARYFANHEAEKAYNRAYNMTHADVRQAWREANREKLREKSRLYRLNNPEKRRATIAASNAKRREAMKTWGATHKAEKRAYMRRYIKEHAEHVKARGAAYRAMRAAASPNDFTAGQWREMKAVYKHRCAYCGKPSQRLTMDHLTPLSKGGAHTKSNIVPACKSCNGRKQAGPPLCPVQPLLL